MKNYKLIQNAINKYYNEKIKKLKKADKILKGCGWIDNPTGRQRAGAIKHEENERQKDLEKLERISQADDLKYIKINVEWHKSQTWGHNPTAEAWTSGACRDTGTASGCGYDKESAAIQAALAGSLSLQKFIIENYRLLKNQYGVQNAKYGLPHLNIGGAGVSTLLNIFITYNQNKPKSRQFKITQNHGDSFDCYNIEL